MKFTYSLPVQYKREGGGIVMWFISIILSTYRINYRFSNAGTCTYAIMAKYMSIALLAALDSVLVGDQSLHGKMHLII